MKNEKQPIEIKVRLHHINSGQCMEVWHVQTGKGKPHRYHEQHICEILSILGKRCNDMDNSFVETHQDECGHATSYFMDEFIGHNLTYQQIRDAKESRFRKACDDYKEANAYYYTLKNNENSTRGIEAELYFIRKQIKEAVK